MPDVLNTLCFILAQEKYFSRYVEHILSLIFCPDNLACSSPADFSGNHPSIGHAGNG